MISMHPPNGALPVDPELQLIKVFDVLGDAVGIHEAGRLVALNPPCLTLFGHSTGNELLGQSLLTLVAPEEHARIMDFVRRRGTSDPPPSTYVTTGLRLDGSTFDLDISVSPLQVGERSYAIVRMRDVTAERAMARALQESEEVFRLIADQSLVGIFMMQDYRIAFANAGLAAITGYSPEEMMSWGAIDFATLIHPEDVDIAREQVRRKQGGESGQHAYYSYRLLARDGTVRHVDLFSRTVPYRGRTASLGVILDVTSRRQAEQERAKLEEALRHSQKIEAVGRLAGGVAHEFNNLLTVIVGNLAAAANAGSSEGERIGALAEARAAADRAAGLTRSLLTFSRRQHIDPQLLDLNDLASDTGRMLGRVLGGHVTLTVQRSETPARVLADAAQLQQALLNLALNARDAMPDGGPILLRVSAVTLDGCDATTLDVAPGRYLRLDVVDKGTGVPEDLRGRLFEPFFTTKPLGHGTGLGLAMVFGVAKQLGGAVGVESSVGAGSTFSLYLPESNAALQPAVADAKVAEQRATNATVLIVEDEPAVRRIARRALERAGYRVLDGENGEAALATLSNQSEPIDLLFTDVVMPGISGPTLAQRALALRPSLRVLFTTGHAQEAFDGTTLAGRPLLSKPYTFEALVDRVAKVLAGGP